MTTVLIAGGGTGGHVFPMVAVGEALRRERADLEVVYVGTGRGIERRVIPELGERLELLDVLPLRGHGLVGSLRGAARAVRVLPEARALVRRLEPQVVFSVGGYAAGPIALVARGMGVPVALLEPNAVLGFTNRLMSRLVVRAYVAFPETRAGLAPERVRWTGVPLRRRFAPQPYQPREDVTLLVLGGSQGARALNQTVPAALAACLSNGLRVGVVHQTGRDNDAEVAACYQGLGVALGSGEAGTARVVPFIDDVAAELAAADVVIGRSGASACAELCAVGRAGVLVPYPFAADDHQRRNAESLERDGAAVCLPQGEASVERLTAELSRLCVDRNLRVAMAEAARRRGRPDAARAVALDLLTIADGRQTDALRHEDPSGDAPRKAPPSNQLFATTAGLGAAPAGRFAPGGTRP